MEIRDDPVIAEQIRELERTSEEEKEKAVRKALAKFNYFLHITGFISGCAFLLIMGILFPPALPYVFIPIGLWTAALIYHGYRTWHPKPDNPKKAEIKT